MDMNLERLKEEQILELKNTATQIEQWEKFKEDYSQLHERLESLPDKVNYEVMVPLGPLAFMPGHLVHTNEVLVLLGENWFAEKSAKEACQVIDRRKASITKKIDGFLEQKKLLESRLDFTSDIQREASGAGGIVDIREEYDSDEEAAWRENRARRKRGEPAVGGAALNKPQTGTSKEGQEKVEVREGGETGSGAGHEKETAKVHEEGTATVREGETTRGQEGANRGREEEDLMARLEELEKREEELDELARNFDVSGEEDLAAEDATNEPLKESNRTVKWKDLEEADGRRGDSVGTNACIPTIHFTHSDLPPPAPSAEEVKTPADIYHHYQKSDPSERIPPKSILKETSKEAPPSGTTQPATKPPVKSISESVFTGSIKEHRTDAPAETQPKKRVSKFKQARQVKGQT